MDAPNAMPSACADRRPKIVDAECGAAAARRKIVRHERIGRRNAARFAETHRHARDDELRIVGGQAARHRGAAPDRARERQHPDSVGLVRDPADRNCDEAIEEREIESADQAELAVGDMEAVLNGFCENRQELPVQEIQHIDETQHAEHEPRSRIGDAGRSGRRGLPLQGIPLDHCHCRFCAHDAAGQAVRQRSL